MNYNWPVEKLRPSVITPKEAAQLSFNEIVKRQGQSGRYIEEDKAFGAHQQTRGMFFWIKGPDGKPRGHILMCNGELHHSIVPW